MALGEDLLLLAIPARGGRVRAIDRIGFALHASVLLDLALLGRIAIVGRRIEVVDPAPVEDKRVNHALTVLCDSDPVPSLAVWLRQTPRRNALVKRYLSVLADQGTVRFELRQKPGTAPWVEMLDAERREAVFARLDLVARARPARDCDQALAGLVHACGLDRHLYRAPFGLRARKRLAGFSQREVAQTARVLAATDAALTEAVKGAISSGLGEASRELAYLMQNAYLFDSTTGTGSFGGGQSWPL